MRTGSGGIGIEDLFSVREKRVLITGGGTGLGRFMAEGFAYNGAKVYITGRREGVLKEAATEIQEVCEKDGKTGVVEVIQGDISTKAGCKAILDQFSARESQLDVLINNAGVMQMWRNPITEHNDPDQVEKLLWDVEDEDWDLTNQVNLNGVYFMTAAAVPLLRKAEDGNVIIISSQAAFANQRSISTLTYGVSKAGTCKLAAMLAGRLSPMKIRVNTICPGAFPSEIIASRAPDGEYHLIPAADAAAKRSAIARAGYPHEIVGPALFLASKAAGYVDDATVLADGGRHMNAGINDGIRMPEDTYWPNSLQKE